MGTAITIQNLGKEFRIGPRMRYRALRDSLADLLAAPWRILRGYANGNSATTNGNHSADPDSSRIWALRDVSLQIAEGEAVGLIGRNGAGKTTLLKILARITRPTTGHAEIRGRIGSLLEVGTGFHPELTGHENLYLSGALLGMKRDEIRRRFDEIVAFSGVEKFLDTPLKHYSTGMQTRLAFAVAAHLDPEILLVDEVLAVGDLEFQKKCLGKMESVSRSGRTVVFVSHQMNQIRRLCEKVVWLESGQVQQAGSTPQVIGAYESAMSTGPSIRPERPSSLTSRASFLRWGITEPAAEQANLLTSLECVTVRFVVQVNSPIRLGRQGTALFDAGGQLLWARAAENVELEPGIHSLEHRFPMLPLRPGSYEWQVTIWDEHGMVDAWHCVPQMIVATEIHQHAEDRWNGVFNLPCEYAIRKLKELPVDASI